MSKLDLLRALCVAPLVLFAGSVRAEDGGQKLGQPDIEAKVIGHGLRWLAEDGPQRGEIFFAQDGTARMTTSVPGILADQGSWRMAGEALCTKWSLARDGAEKCYTLHEAAPGRFVSSGGNVFVRVDPMV